MKMNKYVISTRCVNCRHRFFIRPQLIQGLKIEDCRNKDRKLSSPSKLRASGTKGATCHTAQYSFTYKVLTLNHHLFEVCEIECFRFIWFYLIYFLGADLVTQGKTMKATCIL